MKAIIVDDERLARQEIKTILAKHDVEILQECANHIEAIEAIENERPDVIFLDIQMPEKNGFELLQELSYMPQVVFVTAYDEHALKAFEVNALDYLMKPIDEQRMESALNKVRKNLKSSGKHDKYLPTDKIFIKDGDKCWFVELSEIRMFSSVGNYVQVFFNDFKPLVLKSLNNLEEKLDEKFFFRANRKTIINLNYIDKIEPGLNNSLVVYLKNGEEVEVSRRQSVRFKNIMSL
jgi:two-component system, LytTR family, response regulator